MYTIQSSIANTTMNILPPEDASNIWFPLVLLLGIIGLSALVYFMARSRRGYLYCKRRHHYAYLDDADSDVSMARGDDNDYGEENATECLLKGKLQINNRNNKSNSYQATQLSSEIGHSTATSNTLLCHNDSGELRT